MYKPLSQTSLAHALQPYAYFKKQMEDLEASEKMRLRDPCAKSKEYASFMVSTACCSEKSIGNGD
jgi:hypothetical protein